MTGAEANKDVMFAASIVYLCYDVINTRASFESCPSPIHKWLLGSYVILLTLRMLSLAASYFASAKAAHALLDLRQKGAAPRLMVQLTWWVLAPLVVLWTAWGTHCTWRVSTLAPQCMPSGLHFLFVLLWQLMCYVWIVSYCGLGALAWFLERRLQKAEGDLRELNDEDTERRWGDVGSLQGYASLPANMATGGLTPATIRNLPGVSKCTAELAAKEEDCPVCLSTIAEGDPIRCLSTCGHLFHRSCIDLWLLRSAECPLCKVPAVAKPAAKPAK